MLTRSAARRRSRASFYNVTSEGGDYVRRSEDRRGRLLRESLAGSARKPSKRPAAAGTAADAAEKRRRRRPGGLSLASGRRSAAADAAAGPAQRRRRAPPPPAAAGETPARRRRGAPPPASPREVIDVDADEGTHAEASKPTVATQPELSAGSKSPTMARVAGAVETAMGVWLRAFVGRSGRAEEEVKQLLALELGMLERFGRWDPQERAQLLLELPGLASRLRSLESRSAALAGGLRRLGNLLDGSGRGDAGVVGVGTETLTRR